ncbi:hypothetical protein HCJ39_12255 [Listeria rocourtiae]|uniref:hypothetical protein n=1 Tax=Listeria rocourtiae TaxID=647910 RepID=UPI0016234DDE|nr:hypothetical protein [Listeria rocourtiae]MBC1605487.1 hypothetical protein [Listeria rocourtiae]
MTSSGGGCYVNSNWGFMYVGAVTLFIRNYATGGLHARFALMHIGTVTLFIRTVPTKSLLSVKKEGLFYF